MAVAGVLFHANLVINLDLFVNVKVKFKNSLILCDADSSQKQPPAWKYVVPCRRLKSTCGIFVISVG